MNSVDLWRGKADQCYWHGIAAACPVIRVGAQLVAADCQTKLAEIKRQRLAPRRTAEVIPFVRRAA